MAVINSDFWTRVFLAVEEIDTTLSLLDLGIFENFLVGTVRSKAKKNYSKLVD